MHCSDHEGHRESSVAVAVGDVEDQQRSPIHELFVHVVYKTILALLTYIWCSEAA